MDDLRAASGLTPLQKQMAEINPEWGGRVKAEADESAVNWLRGQVLDHSAPGWRKGASLVTGDSKKMYGFIRANEEILDPKRYPGLKRDLETVARLQEEAEVMGTVMEQVQTALRTRDARIIREMIRRAPSQKAKDTIRLAMVRKIFKFDSEQVAPEALEGLLSDRESRNVRKAVFNDAEIGRLETLAKEMVIIRGQLGEINPYSDPPFLPFLAESADQAMMMKYLAGTAGARVGARFGAGTSGASLRTASRLGAMFEGAVDWAFPDQAEKLIMAAIDPKRKHLLAAIVSHDIPNATYDNVLNRFLSELKKSIGTDQIPAWLAGVTSQQMVEKAGNIMEERRQQ